MAWSLEEAQDHLAAWLKADKALATGQEYRVGDTYLTRADIATVRERLTYWSNQVAMLSAGKKPGARTFRVVPIE